MSGIGINPKLAARIRDADVLLVIGERLGEMVDRRATRCSTPPTPAQSLIHVHPGAEELGRVYQPALAIAATPGAVLRRAQCAAGRPRRPGRAATRAAHADYLAWQAPRPMPGSSICGRSSRWLDARLADDAILTNGAGNYSTGCTACFAIARFARNSRPTSGRWATACPPPSRRRPCIRNASSLSWNGDGCFLMNGQELATAVQYRLDDRVRRRRQRHVRNDPDAPGARTIPAASYGTALVNPDFAALARAYGAHGETVTRTAEFAPAFERALTAGGPALLHLKLDPQALTPSASLGALRAQGEAARRS